MNNIIHNTEKRAEDEYSGSNKRMVSQTIQNEESEVSMIVIRYNFIFNFNTVIHLDICIYSQFPKLQWDSAEYDLKKRSFGTRNQYPIPKLTLQIDSGRNHSQNRNFRESKRNIN